jgi:CheY-like chemotaxis protein
MGARVLIVDDNPINLKLTSSVLETEGFHIDVVMSAEEALIAIESTRPQLVFMDIGLPGMDGLTLTRRLKSDARFRDLRIVALTAFAMKGDDQKALAAGCDGYITKPIDTRTFAAHVRTYLGADPSGQPGGHHKESLRNRGVG